MHPKRRLTMMRTLARLFLFLTVLSFTGPVLMAQMLADFESPESSPPISSEGETYVTANPDQSGINPSDSVGYYEKIEGNWHYVTLHFPDTVQIRFNNTLTFKLRTSTQGRIFAKFYLGSSVVIQNWAPDWNFKPVPNTWVECEMDMTDAVGMAFDRLQLAACVDNEAAAEVWFDDVELSNPAAGDGSPVVNFSLSPAKAAPGEEITLDASASFDYDGEIVEYHWDLGDGGSASGPVVSHTYANDSVYTVTLTLTDNEGKQSEGSEHIYIIHPDKGVSMPVFTTPEPETNRKIEAVFQLGADYENVYDPDQVKLDARILFPSGDSATMPCFYYVPVAWEGDDRIPDPEHASWMLRFSSPEAGAHRVKFILEDSSGIRVSGPYSVEVAESGIPGIVRRDPNNSQYYRHSTGEPFYPLGINIGWNELDDYKTILTNLSSRKANMFRFWQTPFAWQALEWKKGYWAPYEGLGRYNQEAASMTDSLLNLCETLDMYMQLVLFQHGEFSENVDAMWNDNPYNRANGGYVDHAEEFFYDQDCMDQARKLLRYVVARWSYSRNLFAWEFFNEVQFTGMYNSQSELWWPGVLDWHSRMSRYITSIDPCDHLQTTSAALNHLDYLDTIPTLDNLQYHLYEEENLLINEQVRLDRRFLDDLENASIINGEYGTRDGADTPSDMQRHILWNGIMTQVPRYMWVWDHYMDPSWAGLFTPPAEFLEGEDLALHGGPSRYDFLVEHPTRTFRSLGITGDSAFYGYVYDPANGRNHAGTTVTLDSLPVGRYTFTCFGAILGDVLSEDTLDLIRETHELDLPEFNKGIAFKLKYYADYDLPLARAGRDTVVALGTPAYLSGAASRSPGGQPLSFRWTLDERPEGSQAELENPESMEAVLTPDLAGMYLLSLVVSDAQDTSKADQVVVRGSTPPVALAGPDSTVSVKEDYVRLDGSGSFDPDGDELSYEWVLVSAPDSSEKLIYSEEKFLVILKTDVEGIFVLELTVSDGTSESAPDTAVVTVVGEGTGTGPGDPSALETLEDRVRIYPNPGNGTFYLSFPEGEEIRLLEVLGMDGRVLLQSRPGQQAAAPLELRLEKSGRGSGMLIIRLTGTRGISYHKVIIQ